MGNWRLFVENLNYSVTNEQLEELFSDYGEVSQVNIIEVRGVGFIEMTNPLDALNAMNELDGINFESRIIKVTGGTSRKKAKKAS